jgi:hypothetical protein
MGPDYALLRFDPTIPVDQLLAVAKQRGMPLKGVDIHPAAAPPIYTTKLLLSRPDQHIAWRGDALPQNVKAFVDRLCGSEI